MEKLPPKYHGMAGVYCIRNKHNNKVYIGSSSNLGKRIQEHIRMLQKNNHHSTYLQNSYNKYGNDNFVIEILSITEPIKSSLEQAEQRWINIFRSSQPKYGFNVLPTAYSPLGYILPPSHRNNISIGLNRFYQNAPPMPLHQRQAIARRVTGFRHTETTKQKMSLAKAGRQGNKWSAELREHLLKKFNDPKHIENIQKRFLKTWFIQSPSGEIYESDNLPSFCKEHKIPQTGLYRTAAGLQGTTKGGWKAWKKGEEVPNFAYKGRRTKLKSKTYRLIDSDGKEVYTSELKTFAKNNNLSLGTIYKIVNGTKYEYKGWRCPDAWGDKTMPNKEPQFILISPTGEEIEVNNLSQFCKLHNLTPANLHKVRAGKIRHHKGWKLRKAGEKPNFKDDLPVLYIAISPEQIKYEISNLRAFCDEFHLSRNSINSLIKTKGISKKGWRCYVVNDPCANEATKAIEIVDPNGTKHIAYNVTEFSKSVGINETSFYEKLSGRKKNSIPGWSVQRVELPIVKIVRHHQVAMRTPSRSH